MWYQQKHPVEDILSLLKGVDIVFPMIHGSFGEDGRLQGFLELFGIPYVGCDSKTSMICMDKEYMKMVAEKHHLPILPYQVVTKEHRKNLPNYPVIMKPANGGSSIGIGVVHQSREWSKVYQKAKNCDEKVLVEPYRMVRELEIGMLSHKGKVSFSSIGEIIKKEECYDYHHKYVQSDETVSKADIPVYIQKRVLVLAHKIVDIFHLKGFARIDFFYEEETDEIYFNEINTIPGFTTISMYPKLWEEQGISYSKLLSSILESS